MPGVTAASADLGERSGSPRRGSPLRGASPAVDIHGLPRPAGFPPLPGMSLSPVLGPEEGAAATAARAAPARTSATRAPVEDFMVDDPELAVR